MSVVTLITDFGLGDNYVGVMKGMILKAAPSATIVDITHGIRPQDTRQAAYTLAASYPYFPEGSAHLCVVDPGVGSGRAPLAARAAGHFFVGPDNGVFTRIIQNEPSFHARKIENKEFMAGKISSTFHGRDIFGPAAGKLVMGAALEEFGPGMEKLVTIDAPDAKITGPGLIRGAIVHIDHYGNAVTNIAMDLVQKTKQDGGYEKLEVVHHAGRVGAILASYSHAPDPATLGVTVGSWDTLEFFVKSGHAANTHGLCVNDDVEVHFH